MTPPTKENYFARGKTLKERVERKGAREIKTSRAIKDIKSRHNFGTHGLSRMYSRAHLNTHGASVHVMCRATFRYAIRCNIAGT